MSEMIELVANAMLQKAFRNPECIDWDRGTVNFMPLAQAAIEAMREPNQEMMNSGRIYILEGRLGEGEAEEVWRAMIDQALNGSKTPSE